MKNIVLLLATAIWFYGCTSADSVIKDQISQTDLIVADELKSISNQTTQPFDSITYKDLLNLAIANDPEIKTSNFAKERNLIRKEQVDSEKWPRLYLSTSLEFPVNGDDWKAKDGISGGLVFEYDLIKSMFNSDFVNFEEIEHQKILAKTRASYTSTYKSVLELIADIDNYQTKVKHYKNILELIDTVITDTEKADKLKGYASRNLWGIKSKRNLYQNHIKKARKSLDSTFCKLNILVNAPCGKQFEITDHTELLNAIDNYAGNKYDLKQIIPAALKTRSDINLSRYNIYLSKLNIRKAQRNGMPKVSMSLGLGDYETSYNDTETNVLAKLNMSLPVFDFGDTKRKVAIAKLNHKSQEEKLKVTIRKAITNIQNSYKILNESYIDSLELKKWIHEIESRNISFKKLQQMNKSTKNEVLNTEVALQEALIEQNNIKNIVRKQAITCLREADIIIDFTSK